jgi:hypothetical protein
MTRNRLFPPGPAAAYAAAAVLAGALALTGCAPGPRTSANTGAKTGVTQATKAREASATTSAPASGRANIIVYSINSDGPDLRALVSGAVGDYGPAVTVHPDGTVDPSHSSDLELKLTGGSFRLSIAGIDREFVQAASHEPIYPRTCSDYMNVTAPAPIVAGSGTGAYRGISGSFRLTMTGDEVEKKPCQPAAGFQWQVIVLAGHGTVSLG